MYKMKFLYRQITKAIIELKEDERLKELVTIDENAPLALIQVELEAQLRTLKWVVKLLEAA